MTLHAKPPNATQWSLRTMAVAVSRLAKHPRFHMHFTPTSASWLNQVERFFGLITNKRIR
jgi:hypothetical protein